VGNASLAAKQAGYKSPRVVGAKLMRRPEVACAIQQKQEQALAESGKMLGRQVDIGRNDIIMGLADIARYGQDERARVSAWLGLADVFGLRIKNTRDVTEQFAGWTAEELEQYATTGVIPERIRSLVGEDRLRTGRSS
jgi:hypothetical protein